MTEITVSQCQNRSIPSEIDGDVKHKPTYRVFIFIYLDTETPGGGADDRLCQIAFKPNDGSAVSGLSNPGNPISIDAVVAYHITEKMVADKPPFKGSDEQILPSALNSASSFKSAPV